MTHPVQGDATKQGPITLSGMGSLYFGGRVIKDQHGDTFHGDHGYAQYFIPAEARDLPLIFWHGAGQSGKSWESTTDGRDGFWQIFSRRNWPLYIIDQPRRGRAGRAILDGSPDAVLPNLESESLTWSTFRLGSWQPPGAPRFFPGTQFPTDDYSVDQFFRQQTPNTGPEPFPDAGHRGFMGDAVADLVDQVGPAVLVTHSHSAQYGWATLAKRPNLLKAVVSFEPGEFAFPADEPPADIPTSSEVLTSFMAPQLMPAEDLAALTRVPILLILGDNISADPDDDFGVELWRMVRLRAQQFVSAINARGGDATLLELSDAGLKGNSHFPFADKNNVDVADLVSDFLAGKGLD